MSQNPADQKSPSSSQPPEKESSLLLSPPQISSALKSRQGQFVAVLAVVALLAGGIYFSNYADAPVTAEVEAETGPTLLNVAWIWKETGGVESTTTPRLPGDTSLVFSEEGSVYLDTDCDTYRGNWTATGTDKVSVSVSPSSRIACGFDSKAKGIAESISLATHYRIENNTLALSWEEGITIYFEASHFIGTFTTEEAGASVSLQINSNGSATIVTQNGDVQNTEEGIWGTGNNGSLLVTLKARNSQAIAPVTAVFTATPNGIRGVSPPAYADVVLTKATTTAQTE